MEEQNMEEHEEESMDEPASEEKEEMQEESRMEEKPAAASATSSDQARTNAMLAWIFAPITSFVWKDESDPLLRSHARESLYLGVANIAVAVLLMILQFIFGIFFTGLFFAGGFGFGIIISWLLGLLNLLNWAFILVPRIVGVIKANNRETWEVPYVSKFMSRFIKL